MNVPVSAPEVTSLVEGKNAVGTGGRALWFNRIVYLGVSIAGGVALSHLVERPFLALRERVLPPPPRTAPA